MMILEQIIQNRAQLTVSAPAALIEIKRSVGFFSVSGLFLAVHFPSLLGIICHRLPSLEGMAEGGGGVGICMMIAPSPSSVSLLHIACVGTPQYVQWCIVPTHAPYVLFILQCFGCPH